MPDMSGMKRSPWSDAPALGGCPSTPRWLAPKKRDNLHHYFGLPHRSGGLSEILSGQKSWLQAIHATAVPGLDLITSGTLPPNPSDLLLSHHQNDQGVLSQRPKAKSHTLDELQAAIKRFETGGIKPKGCIFNDVMLMNVGYRYYRYAYHYGYKK